MKKRYLVVLILVNLTFSQTKKSIDSLNNIPFEMKLEKANTLDKFYLDNIVKAQKINYKLGEAKSYSNLSLVYYYQGKFEKDLYYSQKAIQLYELLKDNENIALEYGEMGYRMKKRNIKKALYYMQKAKRIAESNHYVKPLLSIYNNYGVLKDQLIQYDSALYFYNKGLVLKEKIQDSTGIPYSLNNIAEMYVRQERYAEAQKLYERALQIRLNLKDQMGSAENYSYCGDINFTLEKYDAALFYYQKTLDLAKKLNYLGLIQHEYDMISQCYELKGNSKEALYNYKQSIIYADSLTNKETNSKIAELEIKFETEKKEKLLLEKDAENKEKTTWLIIISFLTIIASLGGYLIYRQQKLKNKQQEQEFQLKSAIAQIESQNQLQEQRLSISRDLHDNIGAQLTFVISSVDNLKHGNQITDNKIKNQLTKISDFTKSTIIELRDTIWAMNTNEFSFEDLRSRIFNFIENAKSAKETIDFKFNVDATLQDLKFSSLIGINLYRTIQEALNNAVKYADASEISVNVLSVSNKIQIEIQDNGKGFDLENTDFGNGLYNMKKRIEEIGGTFEIKSKSTLGTMILIVV